MKIKNGIFRIFAALFAVLLCFSALPDALAAGRMLVPGGSTVGIKLDTQGVIVCGVGAVLTENGEKCPAKDAGILPGDIIVRLGKDEISSAEELRAAMQSCGGNETAVRVRRGGEEYQFSVLPAKSAEGNYELGIWLRDGIAGIGTVTYIDAESGEFGALGHAVTDTETGIMMPARGGSITDSEVTGIIRGEIGAPGALVGEPDAGEQVGSISENRESGIFGAVFALPAGADSAEMETAERSELLTGSAFIRSDICGGEMRDYEIEILRVFSDSRNGRDMLIKVTDKTLLELTGGIVQGMSGSPIIQNGKLVGAVTHVLVNDPTRGYGIFIGNMLERQ